MTSVREQMEKREREYLSLYAAKSGDSRGRKRAEAPCDLRPVYQRDRDRVLHSKAFRRLKQKTQVFLRPEGDHYRTRLTHTLEVSQNARTIGKALRLNEDLIEAIALGHDLGHTPFGHAGERALNNVSEKGFVHSAQSVRVVEHLEKHGKGLNLTCEVLDGIREHSFAGHPGTLEGCVVRLSDKIAYTYHDFDDALRAGIICEKDVPAEIRKAIGETAAIRLDRMIHDVITTSMNRPFIKMSDEVRAASLDLRKWMFESVYRNPEAKGEEKRAVELVENLYHYYMARPEDMSERFVRMIADGESKDTVVCDYIAGMTDSYAVRKFTEYFIPKGWKE